MRLLIPEKLDRRSVHACTVYTVSCWNIDHLPPRLEMATIPVGWPLLLASMTHGIPHCLPGLFQLLYTRHSGQALHLMSALKPHRWEDKLKKEDFFHRKWGKWGGGEPVHHQSQPLLSVTFPGLSTLLTTTDACQHRSTDVITTQSTGAAASLHWTNQNAATSENGIWFNTEERRERLRVMRLCDQPGLAIYI